MALSLYRRDPSSSIHRGAIYQYRPVAWLEPPLWCIRRIRWSTNPPTASLWRRDQLTNAFRRKTREHEEDVKAPAKVRHVLVVSHDVYCQEPYYKEVSVIPTYTLKAHRPEVLEAIRNDLLPHTHYLQADPDFPELEECFLDFRQVSPLHKKFLENGKLEFSLTSTAIKAVVERLKGYLSLETAP